MCHKGGEMDNNNNQHKTKESPTIFYTKNQRRNKEDLIDATLLTRLEVNGLMKH
jgi:hypothetical protein